MPEFTIILPVYNGEATLERCLDSLRNQTFSDFEVLLTDDGSTDRSPEICRELAAPDARFHVAHQENAGPSAARNRGLDRAAGRYICFVDCDDWVDPEYLARIHDVSQRGDADVIFLGHRRLDGEGRETGVFLPEIETADLRKACVRLSERDMFGYTWAKCFSREAIGDVRFDESMDLFEDEIFACRVLRSCRRLDTVPYPVYNYTIDSSGALTGRVREDYCRLNDAVYAAWRDLLAEMPEKDAILRQKANALTARCRYYGMERDVDIRRYFGEMARTAFFAEHTAENRMDRFIRTGNTPMLRWERFRYRGKMLLKKARG